MQFTRQMILSLTPDAIDTVIFYDEDIAELSQLASQMFLLVVFIISRKTALTKTNLTLWSNKSKKA